MEIFYVAEFESPVGVMRVASTDRGLAYVRLPSEEGRGLSGFLQRFARRPSLVDAFAPNRPAIAQIRDYLEGKRTDFDLSLDLRATDFQRRVYEAVAAIPYGEVRSYAEVARAIGHPSAVRAVGAANGANPLPLVVPCHRVVGSGGHLGGYGGGLPLKRRLLAMESERPTEGRLL